MAGRHEKLPDYRGEWGAGPDYMATFQDELDSAFQFPGHFGSVHKVKRKYPTHRLYAKLPPLPPDLSESPESLGEEFNKDGAENAGKASRLAWHRHWLWESLACSCAIFAVLAIIGVLRAYDHQELPSWPRHIGLNTVIAVFAALWKSMMFVVIGQGLSQLKWLWYSDSQHLIDLDRFDAASRGILGSFRLLCFLRFRKFAVLGAVLMILLVTFDPFAQQTLQYYSCQRESYGTASKATLPRAKNYEVPIIHSEFSALPDLDEPMKGVVISSIENPAIAELGVHHYCPTGNCTFWDPITTIGVCSKCSNVVYELELDCQTIPLDDDDPTAHKYCQARLPQGPQLAVALAVNMENAFTQRLMNVTTDSRSEIALTFAHSQMIALTTANCTRQWTHGGERYPETDCIERADYPLSRHQQTHYPADNFSNVMAVKCELEFCLKTLKSRVLNGVLEESLISKETIASEPAMILERPMEPAGSVGPKHSRAMIPVPCFLNGKGYTFNDITGGPATHPNYTELTINGVNTTVLKDCMYRVDESQVEALNQYFRTALNGSLGTTDIFYKTIPTVVWPPWIQPFYNSGNASFGSVSSKFAAIAEAMTAQIRRRGARREMALGTVHITETCMRVAWGWLILPMMITIAGSIFFGLTIWKSLHYHRAVGIWKSSLLPLMFGALVVDEDGERRVGHKRHSSSHDIDEMRQQARRKNWRISLDAEKR